MKIGVVADTHVANAGGWGSEPIMDALSELLGGVDCLVMCGDNADVTRGYENHAHFFELLRDSAPVPIAFVTGNHELFGDKLRRGVRVEDLDLMFDRYTQLARNYDIVHLEAENLELSDPSGGVLTVFGTYGHYDGTLSCQPFEDERTVAGLVDRLIERTSTLARDPSRRTLMVTHTVPNRGMIGRPDGPAQNRLTPYAGSRQLERPIELLTPTWHVCGHTHAYAQAMFGPTRSVNVGSDIGSFAYLVIDTTDGSIDRSTQDI